jgi:hypothetical protein
MKEGFQFSLYLCSCSEVQTNIDYEKNIEKAMTVTKKSENNGHKTKYGISRSSVLQAFK